MEIATRHGMRLISDETYRYLSRAPLPPAASLDPAVSIGTMSKTQGCRACESGGSPRRTLP